MPQFVQALISSLLFTCSFAADIDDLTYTISEGEITITKCKATALGTLGIPATLEGKPVTTIARATFSSCENLTEVSVPNSVTLIEPYTFANSGIVTINLAEGISTIHPRACSEAKLLQTINIPQSVTTIQERAFDTCLALASISLPPNLTEIGTAAFFHCSKLSDIEIPPRVDTIGDRAFSATGLTSLTLPEGMTKVPAFRIPPDHLRLPSGISHRDRQILLPFLPVARLREYAKKSHHDW